MKIGNKGTILDMFAITIGLLVLAIVIITATYVWDQINPQLQTMFVNPTSNESIRVLKTTQQGFGTFDYIFMFLYFMLSLVPVIFAALVRHHPVFLILNIIILFIFFFIAPVFSNVMREFWSVSEFAVYAYGGAGTQTYPIMTRLFQYLPLISAGFSVILMIAMFAKRGSGEW